MKKYYKIDDKYTEWCLESWVYVNKKGIKRIKTYRANGSGFKETKYFNFEDLTHEDQLFWTSRLK